MKTVRKNWVLIKKYWVQFDGLSKVHNSKIKFFVSIYPALAAVLLAFFKDTITQSTSRGGLCIKEFLNSAHISGCSINWPVAFYWGCLIVWLFLYYKAVFNDSDSNKKNIAENKEILADIKGAVINAPNPDIFNIYKLIFNEIHELLKLLELKNEKDGESIDHYIQILNAILEKICQLTKHFSKNKNAIYGANIMKYVHIDSTNIEYIRSLKKEKEWIYYSEYEIEQFRGALCFIPELIFTGSKDRIIPHITLPIFNSSIRGKEILLLGGPYAAKFGESVINSTKSLKSTLSKKFFENEGKHIASLLSISVLKQSSINSRCIKYRL
jgi:hypothetical protein